MRGVALCADIVGAYDHTAHGVQALRQAQRQPPAPLMADVVEEEEEEEEYDEQAEEDLQHGDAAHQHAQHAQHAQQHPDAIQEEEEEEDFDEEEQEEDRTAMDAEEARHAERAAIEARFRKEAKEAESAFTPPVMLSLGTPEDGFSLGHKRPVLSAHVPSVLMMASTVTRLCGRLACACQHVFVPQAMHPAGRIL